MIYMGKSKTEWIYVHVKLIYFAIQQKHNIINQLYSKKINFKNVQFLAKNSKTCRETEKYAPYTGKKSKQQKLPLNDVQMLDLIGKDSETAIINMSTELKEKML